MRTNKFLVIALAAAGLFTACSNNDEPVKMNQGNGISFRLQGGMPSAKTTASTVDNVDAFVVYGSDNATPKLFDAVSVARKAGTGDVFTYAPNRYYGQTAANAAYVAYSPISAKMTADVVTNILSVNSEFTYTVPQLDATNGNTSQVDLLFATTGSIATSVTAVPLHFDHALSRVFVTATNKTPDVITIETLKLNKLHSTGTIEVTATTGAWDWTPSTVLVDYPYALAQSGIAVPGIIPPVTITAKKFVTSKEQGMMVLPQTTDATCEIEVTYGIGQLTGQVQKLAIPGILFEINKQYSINLEFDGTPVTFTVTVEDYDVIEDVTP